MRQEARKEPVICRNHHSKVSSRDEVIANGRRVIQLVSGRMTGRQAEPSGERRKPRKPEIVEVDQISTFGKTAREDHKARSNSSTGGADPRHVHKGAYVNLGDPLGRQKAGNPVVRLGHDSKEVRLHGSTDEASNDRGGKRAAERSSASEDNGTTHSGGQLG